MIAIMITVQTQIIHLRARTLQPSPTTPGQPITPIGH